MTIPPHVKWGIIGDAAGVEMFQPWGWSVQGTGAAINNMLEAAPQDRVEFWGHGAPGKPFISENYDTLEAEDWEEIAASRKANGLPMFKSVSFHQCDVLRDHDYLNAVLDASEEVSGYEGLTYNRATGSPGAFKTFTKPQEPGIAADGPQNYWWGSSNNKAKWGKPNKPVAKQRTIFKQPGSRVE